MWLDVPEVMMPFWFPLVADILVAYEDAWSPPRQLCFPCVADWLPRQLCLPSVAKLLIWSEVIMLGARLASSVSLAVPPAQLSFPCVSVR